MKQWIDACGKSNKPDMEHIRAFLSNSAFEAFTEFNKILHITYNLGYVLPRFTKEKGWVYTYGRSGFKCVNNVSSKEIYDLMETGKIKCLSCEEIMTGPGVHTCKCGKVYTYHAYRKSFHEDNMPRGAASAVSDRFIDEWGSAKTAAEKMRLIDGLDHECLISAISRKRRRPVGVNLISGTKAQIIELIEKLSN